jgi:hypothetical protein
MPQPMPRDPVIDPELTNLLSKFTLQQDDMSEEDFPMVQFLKSGNGHQVENRKRAMAYVASEIPGCRKIDDHTVKTDGYGTCHFSAFTHPRGAMISSPNREDSNFGSAPWHSRDNFMMFRDAGDGRCIIYVAPIEPLFEKRTIGHHGVKWEDIRKAALHTLVFPAADALKVIP